MLAKVGVGWRRANRIRQRCSEVADARCGSEGGVRTMSGGAFLKKITEILKPVANAGS